MYTPIHFSFTVLLNPNLEGLTLLFIALVRIRTFSSNGFVQILQKNAQKRAKLVALHAQKKRRSSQSNICAKIMQIWSFRENPETGTLDRTKICRNQLLKCQQ